jgi:large subunit ribosomal protein L24
MKLKLIKGDTVVVLSGDDKGKTGKVLRAFPKTGKVLVEGIHVVKRHERKKRNTGKGQVVDKALPIAAAKLAIVDPKGGKPSRVGKKLDEKKGGFVRIAKKSGTTL